VSATVTSTRPPATGRALTVTRPPSGVYFTALSTRLMKICASRSRSADTGGRSDGSWLPRVTRPLSAFGRMIASTDSATSSSRVGASFSDTLPSSMLERSVRSSRRRPRRSDRPLQHRARQGVAEVGQVVEEAAEALGVTEDDLEEPSRVLPFLEGAREQRLEIPVDRGQRGAQLVGDVGHELGTDLLEPA